MGALSGVAEEGLGRVDDETEPVGGVLDVGAALEPDRAFVFTGGKRFLDDVGGAGEVLAGAGSAVRTVGEEVFAEFFGGDVTGAFVGALGSGEALGVSAGWSRTVEIEGGFFVDAAAGALDLADIA